MQTPLLGPLLHPSGLGLLLPDMHTPRPPCPRSEAHTCLSNICFLVTNNQVPFKVIQQIHIHNGILRHQVTPGGVTINPNGSVRGCSCKHPTEALSVFLLSTSQAARLVSDMEELVNKKMLEKAQNLVQL